MRTNSIYGTAFGFLMLLSLAACGNSSSEGEVSNQTSAAEPSPTPVEESAVSGTLEIQYFVGGYGTA